MPTLSDNMKAAVAVAIETRLKVPKSSNYDASSSPIQLNGVGINSASDAQLNALRNTTGDIDRELIARGAVTPAVRRTALNQHALAIIAAGCGNCGELSEVAAYLLLQRRERNIDRVEVNHRGGNLKNKEVLPHAIVVLGRNSSGPEAYGADLGLPDRWGANAVICDPWDRNAYPAIQYKRFWDGLTNALGGKGVLVCKLISHYN